MGHPAWERISRLTPNQRCWIRLAVLDSTYGTNPVSFRIFLRVRPGLTEHTH